MARPENFHFATLSQDHTSTSPILERVKLCDLLPYDGAATASYLRAIDAISGSLMRHNAAIIEVGSDDAAILRCGLDSARFYFRARAPSAQSSGGWSKGNRGVYVYRPGRSLEDEDLPPPCMDEVFRCMGKVARVALCAIAKHLRLRSEVFNHLLDDNPLPAHGISSSALFATFSNSYMSNRQGAIGGGSLTVNGEMEKGLLTLISVDAPGLQVCDPNGHWYLADSGLAPGDLLLLTGKALSHITAGLRPAASYRAASDNSPSPSTSGRTSLAFRLMPQSNAILDCSPIAAAGHVIPQSYVPIATNQLLGELSPEEDMTPNQKDNGCVVHDHLTKEPSLRSILSDHLSGSFLEDAMLVSCGHSFGGLMLQKVLDASRCTLCNAEVDSGSLIPNHALRAAAAAVRHEDDRRLFHNAALRKRRKDVLEHKNGDVSLENGLSRGADYPFSVNEKVVIKGNRRTPDKLVGKEAVITSQCLNGWYLLKIIGTGENVRLQYRSLRKMEAAQDKEEQCLSLPVQDSS